MSDKEWWDEEFSDPNYTYTYPYDDDVLASIQQHCPTGSVLDLGCGEGGLALTLAERGYDVTAIDISRAAISHLNNEAQRRGVTLTTHAQDLEGYQPTKHYNAILLLGVLHLLDEQPAKRLLTALKTHTTPGGIHVIEAWNDWDEGFSAQHLAILYADWQVVESEEYAEDGQRVTSTVYQAPR